MPAYCKGIISICKAKECICKQISLIVKGNNSNCIVNNSNCTQKWFSLTSSCLRKELLGRKLLKQHSCWFSKVLVYMQALEPIDPYDKGN